jgi:hypothetical protein
VVGAAATILVMTERTVLRLLHTGASNEAGSSPAIGGTGFCGAKRSNAHRSSKTGSLRLMMGDEG